MVLFGLWLMFVPGCTSFQRKFLFYPSHHSQTNTLTAWKLAGRTIGYAREVPAPGNVWLVLHGNGGQAADRAYALPCFSEKDSVFILEYPGYGQRKGKPSKKTLDAAAAEGYAFLRKTFPNTAVCVVGESLGSGPACSLANQSPPPDKIVLVVPFDKLTRVAAHHVRYLPVGLLLEAKWDNSRLLSGYRGPVEIFGAEQDKVIPIEHARQLADSLPSARFHVIPGGHNEWSREGRVHFSNP